MPTNPPVTSGLILWLTAETSVTKDGSNRVSKWTDALTGSLYADQNTTAAKPLWVADAFPGYPGIRFDGSQSLFIQTSNMGQSSFTLIALGRATAQRTSGGTTQAGQRFLFCQDFTSAFPSVSVGSNGVGIYEFGRSPALRAEAVTDAGTLCPLTIRYINAAPSVYLDGIFLCQGTAAAGATPGIPHGIGGAGTANGFVGDIAEILIYGGSLTDQQCQTVEAYLQAKYDCYNGSSSSSESSESSDSSGGGGGGSSGSGSESSGSGSGSDSESSESSSESSESSSDSSDSSESSSDSFILPDIGIFRDELPISEQTSPTTVYVGKKIELKVKSYDNLAEDLESIQWSIDTKHIKSYQTTKDNGEVEELETDDMQDETISFYFVDGGDKQVSVSATQDGRDVTSVASFHVIRPTAKIKATSDGSTVQLEGKPFITGELFSTFHFQILGLWIPWVTLGGGIYVERTQFENGGDGKTAFMQIIDSASVLTEFVNDTSSEVSDLGGIDLDFPYSTSTETTLHDAPQSHRQLPSANAVHLRHAITTYLMYKPAGVASIYVPLRKISWYVNADAECYAGNPASSADRWVGQSNMPVNPADEDANELPQWDHVANLDQE